MSKPRLDFSALVLATTNPNKVREFQELFAASPWDVIPLSEFQSIQEADESGTTIAENARIKAVHYARQIDQYVLADDTGLEVESLGGKPGVRSARYAGLVASAKENRDKVLAELRENPSPDRRARFVCHLVIAAPDGQIVCEAQGICYGSICDVESGTGGFGYDSIFLVEQLDRTLATLTVEETAVYGHRGQAVSKLLKSL